MSAKTTTSDLDADLDRLAQAPLGEFVQLRNELAARLREQGQSAGALRVHAMAKPSLSAWAVNQLYWRGRPDWDALMEAGKALRRAQESTLTGRKADVREAGRARDRALADALQRTLQIVADAGHPVTPAMRLRIATNLEALAAYGGAPPETVPGRLTDDLDSPGFEVFDAMRRRPMATVAAPAPSEKRATKAAPAREPRRAAKVVSFEEIANARRALADAEREATARRADAHRADLAVERAREAVKAAEAEVSRLREALADAAAKAEQTAQDVPRQEREAQRAHQAFEEATAAVERARTTWEEARKRR